jgi:nitrogen-specific signal transduction histidine kinase
MYGDSREVRIHMDQSMIRELVDGFIHEVKNPLAGIRVALKAMGKKITPEDRHGRGIEFNRSVNDVRLRLKSISRQTSPS